MTSLQLGIILSEALAVFLIWRLWRSKEHIVLKIAISMIALVPFIGPLVTYWVSNFPEPHHPAHRDAYRYSPDVYDRWSTFFRMTDPKKKLLQWQSIMGISKDKHAGKD